MLTPYNTYFLQYQIAEHRAITSTGGASVRINPCVLVHETNSKLKMHDLVDLVYCRQGMIENVVLISVS
jgi:hypothetical protein